MTTHRYEDANYVGGLSLLRKIHKLQFTITADASPTGRVHFELFGPDLNKAIILVEQNAPVPILDILEEIRHIRRVLFARKGAVIE